MSSEAFIFWTGIAIMVMLVGTFVLGWIYGVDDEDRR